jgi:preprotein translocase subunit SecA
MFEEMIGTVHEDAVQKVFTVQAVRADDLQRLEQRRRPQAAQLTMSGGGEPARPAQAKSTRPRSDAPKVGRNDPCPCGSGKKYKKCHGA